MYFFFDEKKRDYVKKKRKRYTSRINYKEIYGAAEGISWPNCTRRDTIIQRALWFLPLIMKRKVGLVNERSSKAEGGEVQCEEIQFLLL